MTWRLLFLYGSCGYITGWNETDRTFICIHDSSDIADLRGVVRYERHRLDRLAPQARLLLAYSTVRQDKYTQEQGLGGDLLLGPPVLRTISLAAVTYLPTCPQHSTLTSSPLAWPRISVTSPRLPPICSLFLWSGPIRSDLIRSDPIKF